MMGRYLSEYVNSLESNASLNLRIPRILNAIENVWTVLKQCIEARRPVAKSRAELIVHVEEEWALIPMEVVNSACESIARRVEEVRHAGGYATGH